MREHTTFSSFWPYYLREHARPATRAWHYAGSTLAILVLLAAPEEAAFAKAAAEQQAAATARAA